MDEIEEARETALRFIDYQPRTSAEVRRRLERAGHDQDAIDEVLRELEQSHVLDDRQFSKQWIEDRGVRKRYGRTRLAAELRARGVDKDLIEQAVEAVDPGSELAAAVELARKRIGAEDAADPAVRRRVAGFLQRRGYAWEIVDEALRHLASAAD